MSSTPYTALLTGWAWAELAQLAGPEKNAITDGPFGSNLKTEHYTTAGPRVIRLQNIGDGRFRDVPAHVSEERFRALEKHRICSGDLAIATSGEVLPRACVVPDIGPALVKADCIRFRADSRAVLAGYLSYALNSPDTRKRVSSTIHGVGRPRLRLAEIKAIAVPVPPREEQSRIADALDELFSDLDAGVTALERVREKLKLYRASVLKAAVEGVLTAGWRAQHPHAEAGKQLLERILVERRRRRWGEEQLARLKVRRNALTQNPKVRYGEPGPRETAGVRHLPESWCWVTLRQLLYGIEAGKSFRCEQRPAGTAEWGVIKVSAMSWGVFDERENKAVPEGRPHNADYEIRSGDLLLSRSNTVELVGASVLVERCRPMLLLSDKSMRLRYSSMTSRKWLWFALASVYVRQQMSQMATGTSDSMRNISQENLGAVLVPLPPLAEQDAIVEAVEDQLSIIDHLESDIDVKLKSVQSLRQAIMLHAFSGRRVPQNPNDEPASELLRRIAAEREARPHSAAGLRRAVRKLRKNRPQGSGRASESRPAR